MKAKPVFKYADVEVFLNEIFYFTFEDAANNYETAAAAKRAIDVMIAAKRNVKRVKLDLKVLDEKNEPHVITSIHAGHGSKIVSPPLDERRDDVFIDHPKVSSLLKRKMELAAKVEEVDTLLDRVKLDRDPYGSLAGEGDLAARYEYVQSEYKQKMKAAEKLK